MIKFSEIKEKKSLKLGIFHVKEEKSFEYLTKSWRSIHLHRRFSFFFCWRNPNKIDKNEMENWRIKQRTFLMFQKSIFTLSGRICVFLTGLAQSLFFPLKNIYFQLIKNISKVTPEVMIVLFPPRFLLEKICNFQYFIYSGMLHPLDSFRFILKIKYNQKFCGGW